MNFHISICTLLFALLLTVSFASYNMKRGLNYKNKCEIFKKNPVLICRENDKNYLTFNKCINMKNIGNKLNPSSFYKFNATNANRIYANRFFEIFVQKGIQNKKVEEMNEIFIEIAKNIEKSHKSTSLNINARTMFGELYLLTVLDEDKIHVPLFNSNFRNHVDKYFCNARDSGVFLYPVVLFYQIECDIFLALTASKISREDLINSKINNEIPINLIKETYNQIYDHSYINIMDINFEYEENLNKDIYDNRSEIETVTDKDTVNCFDPSINIKDSIFFEIHEDNYLSFDEKKYHN